LGSSVSKAARRLGTRASSRRWARCAQVAVAARRAAVDDVRMRLRTLAAVAVIGLVPACSPKPAKAASGDGELVLELGGEHRSLAASLQARGVTLLPPRALADAPADPQADVPPAPSPSPDGPNGGPNAGPNAGNGRQQAADPVPAPSADQDYFEVVLQPRQTLIDLAKKHLGSGARFTEILKINGWTEANARRLKAGRKVKIPKAKPS
jgi:nucleoid-associated protein YgaU